MLKKNKRNNLSKKKQIEFKIYPLKSNILHNFASNVNLHIGQPLHHFNTAHLAIHVNVKKKEEETNTTMKTFIIGLHDNH